MTMSFEDDLRRELDCNRDDHGRLIFIPADGRRVEVPTVSVSVPFGSIPHSRALSLIGRVNDAEFAGCEPGTLAIAGFEFNRASGSGPKHTIRIDCNVQGGWNDSFPVDAKGQRVFPETDFRELET